MVIVVIFCRIHRSLMSRSSHRPPLASYWGARFAVDGYGGRRTGLFRRALGGLVKTPKSINLPFTTPRTQYIRHDGLTKMSVR